MGEGTDWRESVDLQVSGWGIVTRQDLGGEHLTKQPYHQHSIIVLVGICKVDDKLLPEARLNDQGLRQQALVVRRLAVLLAPGAGDEAVTQAVQVAVLLGLLLVVAVSDLDPK